MTGSFTKGWCSSDGVCGGGGGYGEAPPRVWVSSFDMIRTPGTSFSLPKTRLRGERLPKKLQKTTTNTELTLQHLSNHHQGNMHCLLITFRLIYNKRDDATMTHRRLREGLVSGTNKSWKFGRWWMRKCAHSLLWIGSVGLIWWEEFSSVKYQFKEPAFLKVEVKCLLSQPRKIRSPPPPFPPPPRTKKRKETRYFLKCDWRETVFVADWTCFHIFTKQSTCIINFLYFL